MFESYGASERGFSASLFVTQLILAPLGGLLLGAMATLLLDLLLGDKHSSILSYFVFSLQGLVLGSRMQAVFPRAIESGGRWAWVVPVCNAGFWIVDELKRSPDSKVSNFFVVSNGPGLTGIEMFLVTLPAVASCMYSIGITIAGRGEVFGFDTLARVSSKPVSGPRSSK